MQKKNWKLNNFIKECHRIATKKGWWDEKRNDGELIALMHSELSEALEAMRNHNKKDIIKDNIAEELADCCIRIFDYCGAREIDLEKALFKKIKYNKTRPYRHDKKF